MLHSGASIIDIGGESTRPGSQPVTAAEELERILPAVRVATELCRDGGGVVSVDTYRAEVAKQALEAGAHVVNDISAGALDPDMLATVARHDAAIVLMHTRGTPQNMFDPPFLNYGSDIVQTVGMELAERVDAAERAGIRRWRIILDPGFGFAKTYDQNVELLQRFDELRGLAALQGLPWLVGVSRKSFTKGLAGYNPVTHKTDASIRRLADSGTMIALKMVMSGADVIRVHDTALVTNLLKGEDVKEN